MPPLRALWRYLLPFALLLGEVARAQGPGETIEVQGERPYSAWKIAALVGAILFVLAILLLLRSQN